jgi:transcriptional regulator with XRE-family HTH domain
MSKTVISSEHLKSLRSRNRLSQKQLAGKVGVDVGTVSRWERGAVATLRQGILGKLVEALKTTPEVLCGNSPLPDEQPEPLRGSAEKMNLAMDLQCRNALTLVARRYGVTRQEVVEVAPLLFYIAAEKSLEMRRTRLQAYVDSAEAAMAAVPTHLAPKWAYNEEAVEQEEQSIAARDLFAEKVHEVASRWDEFKDNPLAEFLNKSLREVLPDAGPVNYASRSTPYYEICQDEAGKLVGGDPDAIAAILTGRVGLHELSRELPKASPEERAAWIRTNARQWATIDDILELELGTEKSIPEHADANKASRADKVKP